MEKRKKKMLKRMGLGKDTADGRRWKRGMIKADGNEGNGMQTASRINRLR